MTISRTLSSGWGCLMGLIAAGSVLAQDIAQRPFEREGFAALSAGDYRKCSAIFTTAARQHAQEPAPALAAARCLARAEPERAREFLDLAMRRGYRNCQSLARMAELSSFHDASPRCEANAETFVRDSNPEVLAAYLADQAERSRPIEDVDAAILRDAARRNVVRIAIARRALKTADDYFHAAMVMQHGPTPDDAAAARDLARKAVDLRPWFGAARWLYAAATDRHLQGIGKPQIYGTQYRVVDGVATRDPFDPSAVTDEERARWRVKSLAELTRDLDAMNAR